jgi:hypothetical protein
MARCAALLGPGGSFLWLDQFPFEVRTINRVGRGAASTTSNLVSAR